MKKTFITLTFCFLLNFSLIFAKNSIQTTQNSDIGNFEAKNQQFITEAAPIPFDYFDYLDLFALYFGIEEYLV